MLDRILLGKGNVFELCYAHVMRQISQRFRIIEPNAIVKSLFQCFRCHITEKTTTQSLFEYFCGEIRCRGQLHHSERSKPLLLFVHVVDEQVFLLGGLTFVEYTRLLEEQCFIDYSNISLERVERFFDDSNLLSYASPFDTTKFQEMNPSEVGMLVHSYYCNLESGISQKWDDQIHPVVMRYLLVLCSASPRLVGMLKNYLIKNFIERLERLEHNPLFLAEFIAAWLKFDMCVVPLSDYAEFRQRYPDCEQFYAAHWEVQQTSPAFVVLAPILTAVWHLPGNPCTVCQHLNCPRSAPIVGRLPLPDNMLKQIGIAAFENLLHERLIRLARTEGTNSAIDIWTRLTMKKTDEDFREYWFNKDEMSKIYREYVDETKPHRRTPMHLHQMQVFLSNAAANYRARFQVDPYYDPVVFEVLFLVWSELREREPIAEWNAPLPKGQSRETFKMSVPDEEIQIFINTYWPPCMRNLFFLCEGERHLSNAERTRVSRFILDSRYEPEFGRRIWREFFRNTTINTDEEAFWRGEYGAHFLYQENAIRRSLFPSCSRMIESGHCVHNDIEALARSKCLSLANNQRAAMLKEPRPGWQIYGPMSYSLLTQSS
jgi:hypothetical protein